MSFTDKSNDNDFKLDEFDLQFFQNKKQEIFIKQFNTLGKQLLVNDCNIITDVANIIVPYLLPGWSPSLILIYGPSASGKTNTMYQLLKN